jgi:hypothetical protein
VCNLVLAAVGSSLDFFFVYKFLIFILTTSIGVRIELDSLLHRVN